MASAAADPAGERCDDDRCHPHPAWVPRACTLPAATARELTRRESECCSFFAFSFTRSDDGQLCLEAVVSEEHVDVLDALADRGGALLRAGGLLASRNAVMVRPYNRAHPTPARSDELGAIRIDARLQ